MPDYLDHLNTAVATTLAKVAPADELAHKLYHATEHGDMTGDEPEVAHLGEFFRAGHHAALNSKLPSWKVAMNAERAAATHAPEHPAHAYLATLAGYQRGVVERDGKPQYLNSGGDVVHTSRRLGVDLIPAAPPSPATEHEESYRLTPLRRPLSLDMGMSRKR